MSAQRVRRSRYTVQKYYNVICETCNENIGRTLGDQDPETRADAEQLIRDHERVWHPDEEVPGNADT